MPKQEVFFEQEANGRTVEVVKSYDQVYAREAFTNMDDDAYRQLWSSLKPEDIYDASELPALGRADGEGEAFLWDELLEQAREEGSLLSFFVVNVQAGERPAESLYVSPDWPSAESFAKKRLAS